MTDAAIIQHATATQARAASPATSAWVSASAGSGKTKVLTQRVLALLMAGAAPEKILCLTFTKAAAAEMADRISTTLSKWVTMTRASLAATIAELLGRAVTETEIDRARRLFAIVLDAPGGIKIQTIHAFCQSLLKRFPLEAGVAPVFELLDETAADEALRESWEAVVARSAAGGDPALSAALSAIVARVHESNFDQLLATLTRSRALIERMTADDGTDAALAAVGRVLGLGPGDTRPSVITAASDDANIAFTDLLRAADALAKGTKTDAARSAAMRTWLMDREARVLRFADYASVYLTTEDAIRADSGLATKSAVKADPEVLDIMRAEADRVHRVVETLKAVETAANSKSLIVLADRILAAYREFKQRRSALDYDDLIAATRRLLERPHVSAWVLYKLDGGIDHVLIDEAQDTNPDQWAIIASLTTEFFAGHGRREDGDQPLARTVFGVGDPKQSIFSFQGADPEGFARMEREFGRRVQDADRTWHSVPMNVSFRSTTTILDAVDRVFATSPARDGVVEGPDALKHYSSRAGHAGLVEIWPPVEPEPTDDTAAWKPPIERVHGQSADLRLARLIAERIRRMISGGEMLQSEDRPIQAGDILVLVQRRTAFVEELIRRLKEIGVAVAGSDRMKLTEQIAVKDLMALGHAMLLPEDDLNLAALLKSPLIGLSEDELFDLAYHRGQQSLWAALFQSRRFSTATEYLSGLMARADNSSPYSLFDHVLTACDGRRRLLARLGPEADDPINEFLAAALTYQQSNPPSLQGFLQWIERASPEIKRDLEQSNIDAVRVMTCHGAKGLEAPVVFLPDTVRTPTVRDSVFWDECDGRPVMIWSAPNTARDARTDLLRQQEQARQDRESRRLLYVAMTRARDRLYVAGWRSKYSPKPTCWHTLIANALTADVESVEEPLLNCAVWRTSGAQTAPPDPPRRRLVDTERAALPEWTAHPPGPEPEPPRPLTPSRPARTEPPPQSPVGEDRARRFQRGLVIHRLLQTLPDLAPARRAAAAERYVARAMAGIAASVREQIAAETMRILENPEFAPLFGSGSAAEVPLIGAIGTFRLSGQVDRLRVTEHEVLIIDYKTNRPPPHDVADVDPAYMFQMAAYRTALSAVWPGKRIRCLLLWTDGPFTMELPSAELDLVAARLSAGEPAAA